MTLVWGPGNEYNYTYMSSRVIWEQIICLPTYLCTVCPQGTNQLFGDQLLILNTSLALILFCPPLRDFDEKPKHSSEEIEDHW